MFDTLSDNLQNVFSTLRGKAQITEENIEAAIREVKRALIDADVSLKAIKTFTNHVKEKAVGEDVIKGVSPCDQFIKIVHDELVTLLGESKNDLNLSSGNSPSVILLLGLQGAGKTTSAAKLAMLLKKQGKNPFLVPLDLKRPAAIEQLITLGDQISIPVFRQQATDNRQQDSVVELAKASLSFAKENNFDVVILDSAGRLQIDSGLMAELLLIEKTTNPIEKLLVIDSMIGQDAALIAQTFNTQIGITGIVLTKLDGDARGGAALSVVEETRKPIKLVGIGEKMDALQVFHPERIASRILGMGDVLTFVEQAQEKIQEEEAKEIEKNLLKEFNFETFLQAQSMMSKMGDFSSIFNMLGMGSMLNQAGVSLNKDMQNKMLQEGELKMKRFRPLIQSMTIKERKSPDLLNSGRKTRIAKGAGLKMQDVDKLISEFGKTKKVMDKIQPLLGMFQGQGASAGDMLKGLMPGGNASKGKNRATRRLSKGFNPKKRK